MAIHPSYTIDNADGATFRIDLNNYLDALVTNNSSSTEPLFPQAGMFWVDTGVVPIILRLRDSTNTLWTPIYNVTNGRGIIATTATNANSLNGIYPSTGLVENTIVKNDAVTGINGDVIGNITGYVNTISGDNLATILDITTRSHKNMSVITGDYSITRAGTNFIAATSGFEIALSYTSAISASLIKIKFTGLHYGNSPNIREYYLAVNTVNMSGVFDTTVGIPIDFEPFIRSINLTNINVGDVISLYCDNGSGGTDGSGRHTFMGFNLQTNSIGSNASLSRI